MSRPRNIQNVNLLLVVFLGAVLIILIVLTIRNWTHPLVGKNGAVDDKVIESVQIDELSEPDQKLGGVDKASPTNTPEVLAPVPQTDASPSGAVTE